MQITKLRLIIGISILVAIGIIIRVVTVSLASPKITSIQPDPQNPLNINSSFTITIDRILTNKDDLGFQLSLNTPLDTVNQDNVYTVTPTIILSPETIYTLTITYRNRPIQVVTYATKKQDQLSEPELQQLQSQADAYYADQLNKTLTENPWISQLPIITTGYTAIYNPDTKGINIHLKRTFTNTQRQSLLQQLQTKGIPTNNAIFIVPSPTPTP